MKIAEKILEALNKQDMDNVREEVASSFTNKEMKKFKTFDDFFAAVDVQNAYEDDWKPEKWKKFYKQAWDEFKAGKLKLLEGFSEQDYEIIADILRNDENSSDKEIVRSILNNVSKADRSRVDLLVKKERGNFLTPKYLHNSIKDDIKIIRQYL